MPVAGTPGTSSSSPLAEWKTTARSPPRLASASASRLTSSGRPTPITCRVAPAGFARGPSALKIVRIPSSRRTVPSSFIAGWKAGREEEDQAHVVQDPARPVRIELDRHAARREHVGRPDAGGDRPVAVLGHRGARAGRDDGGRRREVEEVAADAARSARVEQRRAGGSPRAASGRAGPRPRRRSRRMSRPGSRCRTGSRPSAPRSPSRPSGREDLLREGAGQRLPRGRRLSNRHVRRHGLCASRAAAPAPAATKFASSFSPSGVRTDSGWNCTPKTGRSRWASAMTSPSSLRAVTLEFGRQALFPHDQRMVSRGLERIRHPGEEPRRRRGATRELLPCRGAERARPCRRGARAIA